MIMPHEMENSFVKYRNSGTGRYKENFHQGRSIADLNWHENEHEKNT